jgi:hypothetical protein
MFEQWNYDSLNGGIYLKEHSDERKSLNQDHDKKPDHYEFQTDRQLTSSDGTRIIW